MSKTFVILVALVILAFIIFLPTIAKKLTEPDKNPKQFITKTVFCPRFDASRRSFVCREDLGQKNTGGIMVRELGAEKLLSEWENEG